MTGEFAQAAGALDGEDAARAFVSQFDLRHLPPDFTADPFPYYAALRRLDPVHRMPDGGVFLSRYEDCCAVYRDPGRFLSDKKPEFGPKYGVGTPLFRHHTTSLVFNDPPLHSRVRKLLAPAFTPRALDLLQPRFEAMVERLLDRAEAAGGMDVIGDYAAALPVEIIGDMLGVPLEERGPLRDWSLAILGALEPALTPEAEAWGNRSVADFSDYLDRHIAARRALPDKSRGDFGAVLDMLLDETYDGDRLTGEELVQNCIFLLNAGHETTTNLIGNGIDLLLRFPAAKARLIAEPGLMRQAVEEMLRYESSNQLGNRRAAEDCEIGGVAIAAGTQITIGIGAANRDPEQFPDPDRFDIARNPNRHLAFGLGIHACAGMTLARMEGRIAISRLLARFPEFRSAGQPVRGGRARFRGFLSYPIHLW